jgi:hypothetical protein
MKGAIAEGIVLSQLRGVDGMPHAITFARR